MNRESSHPMPIYVVMVLLSVVIFVVDYVLAVGVAAAVPYIVVVLLSLWVHDQKAVLFTSAAVTVLTVVGFFVPFLPSENFWLGASNRLIAVLAIWTTGVLAALLVRRNEVIRRERDFNKSIVETASSIVLLVDHGGRIRYFNRFTTEVSGFSLAETQGKDWCDIFVPASERQRVRQIFSYFTAGTMERDHVFPIVTSQGEELQFSWSSQVMRDEHGQIIGMLHIGQDVSALVEAQQKLIQSERLAAIGHTITALSHEARSELWALQLALTLLEQQVPAGAARQTVDRLRDIEIRLTRLFEDVRRFAAPMVLERTAVCITDTWRRAWASAREKHTQAAELIEEPGGVDLNLSVDDQRIEQVFRNLFENALAACTVPAKIMVTCSNVIVGEKNFVQINVRDDGPGLSPEAKSRIFEPFFTTKAGGTGLGMPICKRIIESHGGDLQIGRAKQGAEFVILLPRE